MASYSRQWLDFTFHEFVFPSLYLLLSKAEEVYGLKLLGSCFLFSMISVKIIEIFSVEAGSTFFLK